MLYKVGDTILIKTWEEMQNTEGAVFNNNVRDISIGKSAFIEDMNSMCGIFIVLVSLSGYTEYDYTVCHGVDEWHLSDWMIKEKVNTVELNKTEVNAGAEISISETEIKYGDAILAGYYDDSLPHHDEVIFVADHPDINRATVIVVDDDGELDCYDWALPLSKGKEMEEEIARSEEQIIKKYIKKYGKGNIDERTN